MVERRRARALRHLGEDDVAPLGEQGTGEAQETVADEQNDRQCQRSLGLVQRVDDVLQHQRHADIGELGDEKAPERQRDPAAEIPEIGQQALDGAPVTAHRRHGSGVAGRVVRVTAHSAF